MRRQIAPVRDMIILHLYGILPIVTAEDLCYTKNYTRDKIMNQTRSVSPYGSYCGKKTEPIF